MIVRTTEDLDRADFAKGGGLLPLVAQCVDTGEVRMLGYANRDALEASLSSGLLHFWSRSRQELWKKGETSGNALRVVSIHLDCDADAALALVQPQGPTCHTGAVGCFAAPPFLQALAEVIEQRAADATAEAAAASGYTHRLLTDRNLRLKKITEEAGELAVACADDDAAAAAEEAADLLYHALVACRAAGVRLGDVVETLRKRHS